MDISTTEDHTEIEDTSESEEFYFESDHLALRDNPDYLAIMKTIVILSAQKVQATKDIDSIVAAEKKALDDPLEFLEKLKNGISLDVPKRIDVLEVPKINLDKYNVKIPDFPENVNKSDSSKKQDVVVRGRMFDQTKPETFNQLWTHEEQRRLEELLIDYPPEAIESQRFVKIAQALGNRTAKQVASRVQKFFQKLHSAGLPIPGRLPKTQRHRQPKAKQHLRQLIKPSTFFPAHVPNSLAMKDGDDDFEFFSPKMSLKYHEQHDEENRNNLTFHMVLVSHDQEDNEKLSADERRLQLLKRIKFDKELINRPTSLHQGFRCIKCDEYPIEETRWHCSSCEINSIDFCSDCFITQLLSSNPHPMQHTFTGFRQQFTELKSRDFEDSKNNSQLQSEDSESEDENENW